MAADGPPHQVTKKEREEFDTIEADVEALEVAAAKAEATLEAAKNAKPRLPQMELLALASKASSARNAAHAKMERYMELDELMREEVAD